MYLPAQATYTDIPAYHANTRLLLWALVAGPVIGLLASGYVRLIDSVSHYRIRGPSSAIAPLAAFAVWA